ncbi:MAG TPA: SDR family NAD(P)-dependent oxidoreductase [Clostridiaceae bacterium]|nr:SDR family NAD(P)-dependent oxidoreductase [Clostridiaceae bacterium]
MDTDPVAKQKKYNSGKKNTEHRVVLISGGSGGIGRATADMFAALGHPTFEVSRSGVNRPGVTHITGDVTIKEDMERAVHTVMEQAGRLDIVFSNAGYGIAGPIETTSEADLKGQFDVNLFGAVYFIQAAIPALRASGGGRILVTSSVAAVTPIPFQSFYTCTKASLNQLVLCLNNELKPFNISCVALMPGDTCTPFTDHRRLTVTEDDPVYGNRAIQSIRKMENDERCGSDVSHLAKRIVKLATQKHKPKPLQGFGAGYRTLLFLTKILPTRLMNAILYKLYASD